MSRPGTITLRAGCLLAVAALSSFVSLGGCQSKEPQSSSQTHWLAACDEDTECGELKCICGTCTRSCSISGQGGSGSDACGDEVAGLECFPGGDPGVVALCDGQESTEALCTVSCADGPCPSGTQCVAGVCAPTRPSTREVAVDTTRQFQELIGIGASLGYDEDGIVSHAQKAALFDAMFLDSGFDVLRLRNRFNGENADSLQAASEIVSEAAARIGATPKIFLSLFSPPASLKRNGNQYCGSSDPDCTLSETAMGEFDYAGLAEHVRASLEAYQAAGMIPEFVGLQNSPDWLPSSETGGESCRLLPEEGTTTITSPEGSELDVDFAGYTEALSEVLLAIASLENEVVFMAPETTTIPAAAPYLNALASSDFGAIAVHYYGEETYGISEGDLGALGDLGETLQKPVILSEMGEDGLDTAVFAHRAFVVGGAGAYLQNRFVSLEFGGSADPIGSDGETFELNPPYFALTHFARHTDPGWVRVDAQSDSEDLLVSAWLAPDELRLTVVAINSSQDRVDVALSFSEEWEDAFAEGRVTRTVFGADESLADLGSVPENRVIAVPGRGMITVSTSR